MDFIRNFPLFTIIISLFLGPLCMALPAKKARCVTIVWECVLLALTGAIACETSANGAFTYVMGEFPAPWGNEIRAGLLESVIAVLFALVMLCSVLGGARFVDIDIDESKVNLYYSLINLMTAALMAMTWTNDIFSGYVFLEILTLTSCGVLIVREIGRTTLAAVRYMILNLLGSGLFLLGVVFLYDLTGHLLMLPMKKAVGELAADPRNRLIITMATAFVTIGLSIKSGLFPFHFWMPDTYGRATPTSGAVLSSLVSKCYIFLLIKIYWRVIGVDIIGQTQIGNILFVLGSLGIVFGSVSAILAGNINRMVAFSSAAQIGYIFLGIGIGGEAGFLAAVFHMLAHAVTKSLLFLTTPRLAEVSGGSLKFRKLQGAALKDRLAGLYFLAGALSMVGVPVFAGFVTKLLLGLAAIHNTGSLRILLVMIVLAVSSLLNALYFIRTVIRIYSVPEGGLDRSEIRNRHEPGYHVSMVLLAAANLFLGLFSRPVLKLIERGFAMFGG